jgi:hypothetical protein
MEACGALPSHFTGRPLSFIAKLRRILPRVVRRSYAGVGERIALSSDAESFTYAKSAHRDHLPDHFG